MPMHLKRGEAFSRAGQFVVAEDGINVSDMTGWLGRCQVRSQTGALIEELAFVWLDAAQRLFRVESAGTAEWPVGVMVFDLRLTTPGGQSVAGPKDSIEVDAGVTV